MGLLRGHAGPSHSLGVAHLVDTLSTVGCKSFDPQWPLPARLPWISLRAIEIFCACAIQLFQEIYKQLMADLGTVCLRQA